jgi:hypothetical protein
MQDCAAGYAFTCFTSSKLQLVIRTVVGLTIAKSKPLTDPTRDMSLSNCSYI